MNTKHLPQNRNRKALRLIIDRKANGGYYNIMFIKSITIRNLRGIKECTIGDFTNVNVFIGRNGSGKSTILESIYLASSWVTRHDTLHGISKIDYVISRRTGRGNWKDSRDVLWFLMDATQDVEIEFTFTNEDKLTFKLQHFDPEGSMWLIIPEKIRSKIGYDEYDHYSFSQSQLLSTKIKSIIKRPIKSIFIGIYPDIIKFLEGVTLIDSGILANPRRVEKNTWSKILAKRLDKFIISMVKEGFEPDAEDITYMPIGGDNVLALKLSETTVRIDDLGDGARNAILLASILLTLNNTAVLIEEPESHQHPGGLKTVVSFILKTAKERRLQLFISTHSIELLRILHKLCSDVGLKLRTFFLERNHKGIVDVRVMEHIDVDILLKLGLDPRFLDVI